MTQLAVGFKSGMSSGREQRTDGLWKHLGLVDGGSLRATNNLTANAPTGAGLELLYDRPSLTSYVLSFDRDVNAYRDLNIVGHNINLQPAGGGVLTMPAGSINTAALAAGAVHGIWQAQAAPGGSTTSTTPAPMPAPFNAITLTGYTGGPLLITGVVQVYHSLVGAAATISIFVNNVDQNLRYSAYSTVVNGNFMIPIVATMTLAAGSPVINLYWNTGAGTLNSQTGLYYWLVVQELRR